jgi:hypothetical protein
MAVIVTLSPNADPWTYGDPPRAVSFTGAGSGVYINALFSSDSGTFANRFTNSTFFLPKNSTTLARIYGQRVARVGANVTGLSFLPSLRGYTKTASAGWNAGSTSDENLVVGASVMGFIEFESNEATTEKAAGLSTSFAYKDPNLTGTTSFRHCWHLGANGVAVPRKEGVPLAAGVAYVAGDIFRVEVSTNTVTYKLKGATVATASVVDGTVLYGVATFNTQGATLDNMSFLKDSVSAPANYGYTTLQVGSVFPVQPNYALDLSRDNNTLFSYAEDGSFTGIKKSLSLQFTLRPFSDYVLIADFWDSHQKHLPFIYEDLVFGESYQVVFDGGLKAQAVGPDQITISCSIREI